MLVMLADSKDVITGHVAGHIAGHLMMTTAMSLCAAAHSGVLISEDRCHIRAILGRWRQTSLAMFIQNQDEDPQLKRVASVLLTERDSRWHCS